MNADLGLICWIPLASRSINTFGEITTGNLEILPPSMSIIWPIGGSPFYKEVGEGGLRVRKKKKKTPQGTLTHFHSISWFSPPIVVPSLT